MSLRQLLISLFMFFFATIIQLYTILTLPLFYLIQRPWKVLTRVNRTRSVRVNPNDPHSAYIRVDKSPYHVLCEVETLNEAFNKILTLYPTDQPAVGYREIISEQIILDEQTKKPQMIDGKMLRKVKLSGYNWLTLGQVFTRVDSITKGLYLSGMQRLDRIAIFGETSLDFFLCYAAIDRFGGVLVTAFSTMNDEGVIHAFGETQVKVILTSHELLYRVKGIAEHLPSLERVVYFDGPRGTKNNSNGTTQTTYKDFPSRITVSKLSELEQLGAANPTTQIAHSPLGPDDTSAIMYTSGTTGVPKGVTATQRQCKEAGLAMLGAINQKLVTDGPRHTYVAYLPMAHILEASVQMFLFAGGVKIGFATPFTLNDSAPGLADGEICDLKLLRPTIMTCVPLVLDRLRKEMYEKLRSRTPVSEAIFNYLMEYKIYWKSKGYDTPLVNALLCSQVKAQLGGKLEFLIVGGAPLCPKLQALIKNALNVSLLHGYGATETLGAVICTDLDDNAYGHVGAPLVGVKVKLKDWEEGGYRVSDVPNPRGELVVGGSKLANGYYGRVENSGYFSECDSEKKNGKSTAEMESTDQSTTRWFATGDIAEVLPNGTFKIIDRKSDLVKLQNGEYVALGKIEASLKNNPLVDNICVCSNPTSNHLIALVVPHQKAFAQLKSTINKRQDNESREDEVVVLERELLKSLRQTGVSMNLHRRELPSRVRVVCDVWSPDNDFLTAAMKLRRKVILKHYKAEIEQLFAIK